MLTKSLPTCQNRRLIFRTMLCSFRGTPRECPRTSTVCGDLPDFFQSATPFIYADDTKLLQAIRSSEDTARLQSDINSASDWSISTDLLFNESKFIHLHFFSATVLSDHPIYTLSMAILLNLRHSIKILV